MLKEAENASSSSIFLKRKYVFYMLESKTGTMFKILYFSSKE